MRLNRPCPSWGGGTALAPSLFSPRQRTISVGKGRFLRQSRFRRPGLVLSARDGNSGQEPKPRQRTDAAAEDGRPGKRGFESGLATIPESIAVKYLVVCASALVLLFSSVIAYSYPATAPYNSELNSE